VPRRPFLVPPVRLPGASPYGPICGRRCVQIIVLMYDISNMRFHNGLEDLLGNGVRLRILRVLASETGHGFTGRDLARRCNVSASQAITALRTLEESGIVFRQVVGRSHMWTLAADHEWAKPVQVVFADEAAALERLMSELKRVLVKLPAKRAWLFGSIARGDERPTSDVDIFIEVKNHADRQTVLDKMSSVSGDFALRFGNPVSTLVWSSQEMRQPPNPQLLATVQSEGLPIEVAP